MAGRSPHSDHAGSVTRGGRVVAAHCGRCDPGPRRPLRGPPPARSGSHLTPLPAGGRGPQGPRGTGRGCCGPCSARCRPRLRGRRPRRRRRRRRRAHAGSSGSRTGGPPLSQSGSLPWCSPLHGPDDRHAVLLRDCWARHPPLGSAGVRSPGFVVAGALLRPGGAGTGRGELAPGRGDAVAGEAWYRSLVPGAPASGQLVAGPRHIIAGPRRPVAWPRRVVISGAGRTVGSRLDGQHLLKGAEHGSGRRCVREQFRVGDRHAGAGRDWQVEASAAAIQGMTLNKGLCRAVGVLLLIAAFADAVTLNWNRPSANVCSSITNVTGTAPRGLRPG